MQTARQLGVHARNRLREPRRERCLGVDVAGHQSLRRGPPHQTVDAIAGGRGPTVWRALPRFLVPSRSSSRVGRRPMLGRIASGFRAACRPIRCWHTHTEHRALPGYGFGTLRCATDDVNGDNVAYLFFPSGINHVFCYAYYVRSPPLSGTIVIRDRVEGGPAGADPGFAFSGSVSYDPDGFTLKAGQRVAFRRGAERTWQVTESTPSHYQLKSVDCRSSAGTSIISTGDTTVSVALAAGDTVDCTFVNRWVPPVGTLTLFNTTLGGVGSFGYIVGPYNDDPTLVTTTSRRSGVPVEARPEGNLALYSTTRYVIQELPPSHPGGHWTLVSAVCAGAPRNVRA